MTPPTSPRARSAARQLAVVLLAGALVAAACSTDEGDGDTPSPTNRRTPQAAPEAPSTARLDLTVRSSSAGAELEVAVTAPDDASEMQVGTDPSFTTTPWEPITDTATLSVDGGYQEVFARFRSGPEDEPEVFVAGIDVDLARQAATSDKPAPTMIGLATPTSLVVDVEVGRVKRGLGNEGDELDGADIAPKEFDGTWNLAAASGTAPRVSKVVRATKPIDTAHDGRGEAVDFAVRHRMTLTLSTPLLADTEYSLTSPIGTTTEFTIDDRSSRSPAVHANQVGFRPGDTSKRAFVTAPIGSDAFDDVAFVVVDAAAPGATPVFDGRASRQATGSEGEAGKGDVTGLSVWALDFSAVSQPGRYKVCVDGIGCSESFSIDENTTWMRAATTVARGLYLQRSGIAFGEPTTSIDRPRPDHPDDGLVVHRSTLTSLEAADLTDDKLFPKLVAGATDEVVDGAWGGHFDAGDWDRRSQHLWVVREVFDLLRIAPDRFATLDLNLPESGDAIPDVADEALWTLDLFRRLQGPDGAVGGGVESARFPDYGTPSWKDDLARYAYAPDPWTSYMYAGAAADASVALRSVDPTRAQEYADSALAAMGWADSQNGDAKWGEWAEKIAGQRAVAAASLLTMTGDARWNQTFLDNTQFADGPTYIIGCNGNELCDAGWNYLWADRALTDPAVVANIVESFRQAATRSADASDSTLFNWCIEDPDVPLVWGLGTGGAPHAMTLLRGYLLTGEQRFLAAAERCASVSLGGNPIDTSFVTGLGANPARHPLIVDVNVGHLPTWAGTPVYGNHPVGDVSWVAEYRLKPAGFTGDPYTTPYLQSWWDLGDVGPMNEFTVYQSHGPAMWVFGVLASADRHAPPPA